MSIRLILESLKAEKNNDFHIIRLLILLSALKPDQTVAGITKLAKLDFLLRYPSCLEKALRKLGYKKNFYIAEFEKNTIESAMIKFHYGPWDKRYREWISIMQAKDLISVFSKGKTVYIGINENGRTLINQISGNEHYIEYISRSKIIVQKFNSYSSKKLLEFMYATFPELSHMKSGEEIQI